MITTSTVWRYFSGAQRFPRHGNECWRTFASACSLLLKGSQKHNHDRFWRLPCCWFGGTASNAFRMPTHMTGWDEALLDQGHLNLHAAAAPLCRPTKILLVRHGESRGNRDETAYAHCPDWKIPLTRRGWGDARLAGERVKEVVGDAPLLFYCSPYRRTKQTLAGMMGALETNDIIGAREEPRLTEQQFGNFQNVLTTRQSKDERARFGRFYYRFPQGESGLDVYNRSTSFIATMHRDMANPALARPGLHSVIVTHGLTLRLFLMRWFQYSVEDFEESHNPPNGGVVIMEKVSDPQGRHEWYELTDDSLELLKFKRQHRYGSLWKLLDGLPQVDELGEDDDGSDCFEDNYYFNPDEDSIE